MSSIWVYPGQGAQKVNMLHDLPEHRLVQHYLDRASVALQRDVLTLDQPEALRSTEAVQLCLYLAGYISSAMLLDEQVQPDYVAGLSIGAWTAAAVAGVYSFEKGLKLVSLRGRLMQEAYPSGYGMTAIINADKSQVSQWVADVYQQLGNIYVANLNAANQIVISGSEIAMQQVIEIAKNQGAIAKKLNVSVPSHCELLDAQAQQLVHGLLPQYTAALRYAPTSYRPRKWSRECSRGGRMTGVCMLIRSLRGPITVNGFCGCSPTPTPTANPVSGGWGSRLKTWRGAFCRVPSLIHAGRPRCCTSCV